LYFKFNFFKTRAGKDQLQINAMKTQRIENLNRPIRIDKTQKLSRLLEYLKSLNDEQFTGYLKINFSQGSIARIERFEEISKKLTF
jgi:hypothetical protein